MKTLFHLLEVPAIASSVLSGSLFVTYGLHWIPISILLFGVLIIIIRGYIRSKYLNKDVF